MRELARALARRLETVMRPLERAAIGLAILMLLFLLVLANVEVAGRYFIGYSTLIADEYGGYAYTWIVLLGVIHLLRSDRYLTMTLLIDKVPRLRNAFGLAASVIGLAISAVLMDATFDLVRQSWTFGTRSIQPSETPIVLPQLILPIGYAVLALAYVEDIVRRIARLPPRRQEDDAATFGEGEPL